MESKKTFSASVRKTLLWGLTILLMTGIVVGNFLNIFIYNAQQAGWENLQGYQVVYDFLNNQYSYYCVLPLSIILWLAIIYSMLKRGEIDYGRYLGKFPNFKIATDNFIKGLPKFRVALQYILLGGFMGVILNVGFVGYLFLTDSDFLRGLENLAYILFALPGTLLTAAFLGYIIGAITGKNWGAILGGIGGVVGVILYMIFDEFLALYIGYGIFLGLIVGMKTKRWRAVILGGIVGWIVGSFVLDWQYWDIWVYLF